MLNLPIHWYEGMFLRPQHFQAAERYWTEVLGQSSLLDVPYNYGFATLSISHDAIGRGEFGIQRAAFRMRDGSVWFLDDGQCPERVSLKSALDRQDSVMVLLAIPTLQAFRENVSIGKSSEATRYLQIDKTVQDENGTGDPQELQFRRPEFRLMLSSDDTTGYETLEIARVKRGGDGKAVAVLDETYFPPLLNASTWESLREGILRSLNDQISSAHQVLAAQVLTRGTKIFGTENKELAQVIFLHELNKASATLGPLIRANGVHPMVIYTELCRIMGSLSIFLEERVCGEVKSYDHDDLATVFRWIRDEIVRRLKELPVEQFETSLFIGNSSNGMEARLRQQWLAENWQWYVGARSKDGDLDSEKLAKILTSNEYVFVLASPSTVHGAFVQSAQGLSFDPLTQVPFPLPSNKRWAYFKVRKSGQVWSSIISELSVALEFKGSAIANPQKLAGSKWIEFQMKGATHRVELCLFAVPSTQ